MALYFETELQGLSFLLLCGVGFFVAMFFEAISALVPVHMKVLSDILLFLLGGLAFIGALFLMREEELRMFHWLALVTGALLYMLGVRRLALYLIKKMQRRKAAKAAKKAAQQKE
jgi:hypothetical protein